MANRLTTSIYLPMYRNLSPRMAGQLAQQYEATGVVDQMITADQLTSWFPRALWRPDVTAMAEMVPDCDSFPDAFQTAAFAAAATERLGVAVSTDAIRRGPAELMQTMLTLASATEGDATLCLGAGEVKHAKPFGYRRSEGLARLEDHLRLYRMLWECDGPFDFDGNVWHYRKAWLGSARPYRPKVWAMGGGPKLIELAAAHADGLLTLAPGAFPTPEDFARMVTSVKQLLERQGRDPEAFDFGVWSVVLLHDDPGVIDAAFDNPLVKWLAIAGRLHQGDWRRAGLEPIAADDWHYALHLLPAEMSQADIDAFLGNVTKAHAEKSYISGTSKEVSQRLSEYVDAGATWVGFIDFAPCVLPLDEMLTAIGRSFDVCSQLKAAHPLRASGKP